MLVALEMDGSAATPLDTVLKVFATRVRHAFEVVAATMIFARTRCEAAAVAGGATGFVVGENGRCADVLDVLVLMLVFDKLHGEDIESSGVDVEVQRDMEAREAALFAFFDYDILVDTPFTYARHVKHDVLKANIVAWVFYADDGTVPMRDVCETVQSLPSGTLKTLRARLKAIQ